MFVLHVIYLFGQRAVVTNYALVQSYFHQFYLDGLGPAWTLVVEMSFYVSLPVFASLIRRMARRRPLVAEIAGLVVLFWIGILCTAWSAFGNPPLFVQVLPMNLSPFALGMLLAVLSIVFQQRELPTWLSLSASRPWVPWLVALTAWTAIVWAVHYPTALSLVARVPGWKVLSYTLLLDVIGLSMVFPAVFGDQGQGVIRRVLQMRFVVLVGVVSYGVYLWHDPIISELSKYVDRARFLSAEPYLNWLAITTTVLAASVLVAMVSWFAVERPLIAVSRHPFTGRRAGASDDQMSAGVRETPFERVISDIPPAAESAVDPGWIAPDAAGAGIVRKGH